MLYMVGRIWEVLHSEMDEWSTTLCGCKRMSPLCQENLWWHKMQLTSWPLVMLQMPRSVCITIANNNLLHLIVEVVSLLMARFPTAWGCLCSLSALGNLFQGTCFMLQNKGTPQVRPSTWGCFPEKSGPWSPGRSRGSMLWDYSPEPHLYLPTNCWDTSTLCL